MEAAREGGNEAGWNKISVEHDHQMTVCVCTWVLLHAVCEAESIPYTQPPLRILDLTCNGTIVVCSGSGE